MRPSSRERQPWVPQRVRASPRGWPCAMRSGRWGPGSVRMILSVDDPDSVFEQAIASRGGRGGLDARRVRVAMRARHRPLRPRLGDEQTAHLAV